MNIEISKLSMADTERGSPQSTEFKQRGFKVGIKYVPVLFKIVELILAIVCVVLIDDPANNSRVVVFVNVRSVALNYATYSAFIIICGIYILGKIIRDTIPWKILVLLNLLATVMFFASGAVLVSSYMNLKSTTMWTPHIQRMDLLGATAGVAFLTAVLFLIDFLITTVLGVRGTFD